MKRVVLFLVAFLALGVGFAQAQIKPDALVAQKGQLLNSNGTALTDTQVKQIIGDQIYNATYLGAKKQFNAGKKLILWGAIGTGVGVLASGVFYGLCIDDPYNTAYMAGLTGGLALLVLGDTALAVGIPLKIIGKKRLEWIADDYNAKQSNVSLNITGCRGGYGLGLALNF